MPAWTPDPNRFPRFPLIDGPSPLQPLPRFSAALGGRVDAWVKREDLLPLTFGGNKLRNLEYLLGAALAEGADTVVTSGRRWSNHARLTAAAGARAGLAVHVVLSGPPIEPPGPGVTLTRLLGATVHQTATADRAERAAAVERVTGELREAGRRPFVIGVGGSALAGLVGQVTAGLELVDDATRAGIVPEEVIVPSATGGTQAGLLSGLATAGARTVVRGIAVARPAGELQAMVEAALDGLAGIPGLARVASDQIVIDGDQLGDGYGVPSSAARETASLLATTEGILVDPIYTAKALAGLAAAARSGRLDGRTVVFWHAGGLPGLFEPPERAARES